MVVLQQLLEENKKKGLDCEPFDWQDPNIFISILLMKSTRPVSWQVLINLAIFKINDYILKNLCLSDKST